MNIRKDIDYSELFAALDKVMAAGLPQMELYCEIGRFVSTRTEKGAAVATAEYLAEHYPEMTGFSPRNVRRMRNFYSMYAERTDLLQKAMQLGWTQNVVILESDLTLEARGWYLQAAVQYGWSKTQLQRQIDAAAHLQATLDKDSDMCYTEQEKNESAFPTAEALPTVLSDEIPTSAAAVLSDTNAHSESDNTMIPCHRLQCQSCSAEGSCIERENSMSIFRKKTISDSISATDFSCRRDGLTLRGREYRPAGDCLPAAIVCHGFMANQSTVTQYTQALAGIGYAAYCFDFNGGSVMGSKSDGKTTDMSVLTEVADLETVLAYVRNLPYVDESNILLMGCSQGGFVSALTAARHSDEVARLELFYPALCIPDDARAGKMMMAKFDPANVPQQLHCGPMRLGRQYVTDVLRMNPFAEIAPYTGPVLIIHGTQDNIVAPDYARRAYETYRSRTGTDSPVSLQMIEGGGHGFSKKHDAIAIHSLEQFARIEPG